MARNRKDEVRNSDPFGGRAPSLDFLMDTMTGEDSGQNERAIDVAVPTPVVVSEDGVSWIGHFGVSRRGLYVADGVDQSEWEGFFSVLETVNDSLTLLVGDYLKEGENRQYGVTYELFSQRLHRPVVTLRNNVWVCNSVDLSLRSDKLVYSHYEAVAHLSYENQTRWLERAVQGDDGKVWSARRLEAEIEGVPVITGKRTSGVFERFQRATVPYENRVLKIAQKAAPEQREEMATQLERLAAQIRSGSLPE